MGESAQKFTSEFFEADPGTISFFYYTPFGQYADVFPCVYEHDNLETLLQEKDIQANLVYCLQHLQLRFETEDKARRLLSNVSFLLKPWGYFFGITPDLSTIWYAKVIGKYRCFWIVYFPFFFFWLLLHLLNLKRRQHCNTPNKCPSSD
ncbi:hypothetical protein ES332_D12G105600v1 [Gossypium tomentosum]|uniref:mRNA (guanine-N(7))-methyltransferase n=1 Tax=Gossypium tomentosum TaxID=34277 RepID=A0A5D2I7F3_GOSTO|nr:hypothetical protein ES332_D12G105600v1 [Gossypium tomentosum]